MHIPVANVDLTHIAYRQLKLTKDHVHISRIRLKAVGLYVIKQTFEIFIIWDWELGKNFSKIQDIVAEFCYLKHVSATVVTILIPCCEAEREF